MTGRSGGAADEGARAGRQVESILRATEDAAEDLRREAERKADERIAEATRAASARVEAAEAEAAEILAEAQHRASAIHETAGADAARIRREAEAAAATLTSEARDEARDVQRIAEVFAEQTRAAAEEDAAKRVARARELVEEVLTEGSQLSHHVRQLSDSLRVNAKTLLDDVQAAHRVMTAKLGDAASGAPSSRSAEVTPLPRATPDPEFGEIPEFIPAEPRRRA